MKKNIQKTENDELLKKDEANVSESFLSQEEEKNISKNEKLKTNKKVKPKKQSYDLFEKLRKNLNKQVQATKEITLENKEELKISTQQKLESAKEDVKNRSSRTKIYFYALFLIINLACFSVVLFVYSGSAINLSIALSSGSIPFIVIAFLSFLFGILVESLLFSVILKKSSNRFRFALNFKTVAIGKYYDAITPFKGGGQPFQIYYLNRFGEKGRHAASVPVTKFVVSQFVYLIAIVVLLFNIQKVQLFSSDTFSRIVNIAAYIGLGVQVLWLLTILVLSYSKKIGPAIVIGVLKFLAFFRIIKDYRAAYIKVLKFVKEYQYTMRKCMSDFWQFVYLIFSNAIIMLIKWSVPFFIYCGLCGPDISVYFTFLAYSMLLELALGFWILPGNVIFADISFIAFFRPLFGSNLIFWALLFWRIITYYSYILLGALVKSYDVVKYNWIAKSKLKKSKNNNNQQNE